MSDILGKIAAILVEESLLRPGFHFRTIFDFLAALEADGGNRFIEFDAECFVSERDLKNVVRRFSAMLEGVEEFEVGSVSFDPVSERASVSVTVNGTAAASDWDQKDDWLPSEFFDFVRSWNRLLRGRMVEIWLDQSYRAIYVKRIDAAEELTELFSELAVADME